MHTSFCKKCGSKVRYLTHEGRERAYCSQCREVQYEQLIVGAGALIEQKGRVLLLRRTTEPFKGQWNLPAGHVEADEDPKRAVEREVKEETGLQIETGNLYNCFFFEDHPKGSGVFLVYSCRVVGGSLSKAEQGAHPTFFAPRDIPSSLSGGGHKDAILSWRQGTEGTSQQELWAQLTNAISLRSSQDQVLWSIFGSFWATNAILLVALFSTGKPPEPLVGFVVSLVGLLVSGSWHVIWMRALGHVKRHEALMQRIESRLGLQPEHAVSAEINRSDYKEYVGRGIRARQVMPFLSVGATILWFASTCLFVFQLASKASGGGGY